MNICEFFTTERTLYGVHEDEEELIMSRNGDMNGEERCLK